ncbi:MAG: class I SAM-dependent methyltransferase [Acidobacteriales bacterium]|nr:class I SAM-dependent methyltransferase [Terriglobales bacterium]
MIYRRIQRVLPGFLRRYLLYFEQETEEAVRNFAAALSPSARVLDAGAGEGAYRSHFSKQRYVGFDLGIGDAHWNYRELDVIGNLSALPFRDGVFDASLNIVTLEHVREPAGVLREIAGVLKPGGRLLLVVPQEWEVHQAPHDYFRYTRFGCAWLLEQAGFERCEIRPVGGYFRLISRRLLNGLQFFPGILLPLAALLVAPPALLAPLFDRLDRRRDFTLGYICTAYKRS